MFAKAHRNASNFSDGNKTRTSYQADHDDQKEFTFRVSQILLPSLQPLPPVIRHWNLKACSVRYLMHSFCLYVRFKKSPSNWCKPKYKLAPCVPLYNWKQKKFPEGIVFQTLFYTTKVQRVRIRVQIRLAKEAMAGSFWARVPGSGSQGSGPGQNLINTRWRGLTSRPHAASASASSKGHQATWQWRFVRI